MGPTEPAIQSLRRVEVPVLVVCGSRDALGPSGGVRTAFDAWGADRSTTKTWRLLDRESVGADYGHMDLMLGARAVHDVFEPVRDFLCT